MNIFIPYFLYLTLPYLMVMAGFIWLAAASSLFGIFAGFGCCIYGLFVLFMRRAKSHGG